MAEFEITRMVIGRSHRIAITQDEYSNIASSRKLLNETSSLEEKFLAIAEQFYELEKYVISLSLETMIFGFNNVASMSEIGSTFGRIAGAMLSMSRLYTDTAASHLEKISLGALKLADCKAVLSGHYDASFEYRVIEAVRNHVQHRAFPVHTTKFPSKWTEDRSAISFQTKFYLEHSKLQADDKFKKSVLKEIDDVGGPVELNSALRSYFGVLCDIHTEFRKLAAPFVQEAEATLDHWRRTWSSKSTDPSLSGVATSEFDKSILTKGYPLVYLDPELDEYRRYMVRRTQVLTNMSKRQVIF